MTASRLINPLSNTNCSLHEQHTHKVTKTKSRQSQVSRGRCGALAGGWKQDLEQEHRDTQQGQAGHTLQHPWEKGNATPKVQLKSLDHNSVGEG